MRWGTNECAVGGRGVNKGAEVGGRIVEGEGLGDQGLGLEKKAKISQRILSQKTSTDCNPSILELMEISGRHFLKGGEAQIPIPFCQDTPRERQKQTNRE